MRFSQGWRPPLWATEPKAPEIGDVIGEWNRAWEITHLGERQVPSQSGYTKRATLHLLHGPPDERVNDRGDMAVSYADHWRPAAYYAGRVWLCSCCGHPAPCRLTVAEEESARAARTFEERLSRMGPGICYGCGEVITTRQDRITYPGDHADFPGRPGPTFHTRRRCYSERAAYAQRAGLHIDGGPIPPPCEGHLIHHADGSAECTLGGCEGPRAQHRMESWQR